LKNALHIPIIATVVDFDALQITRQRHQQ